MPTSDWNQLFIFRNLCDNENKALLAWIGFESQTACLYILRFWVFLGECLGDLSHEEVHAGLVTLKLLMCQQDGGA